MAAVGTTFPVIFMITSLFMGWPGATIKISQYYGANDMDGLKRAVDTIYIFLFSVSIPIALIGLVISKPMLRLTNVPDGILPMATTYMRISFWGHWRVLDII